MVMVVKEGVVMVVMVILKELVVKMMVKELLMGYDKL